ncbi:hypothetical protein RFI_34776 [Reticulomyxa filosa]|uniref:Uncharacterized protein n=1 Tax=Reticulomyxa filosa TaxID=46433 RepID=X6LL11_RETFI|nr:hypothetical protein RFI_34776 [Reticulomyxa filosa]|eukprot:ETO02643.1 hypothetical protein RFI_34776 [Reticulomyxa filosa]
MAESGTPSEMKEDSLPPSSSRSKHLTTDSLSTPLQKSRRNSSVHLEIRKASLMEQESLLDKVLQGDSIPDNDNDPMSASNELARQKSELAKWKQLYGDDIVVRFITVFNLRNPGSKTEDAEENDLGMLTIKFPLGDMNFESRLKIVKKTLNESKKILEKASSKCITFLSDLKGLVLPLAIGTNGLMWRFCCATNPTFSPLTCGIASFAGNIYKNPTVLSFSNSLKKKKFKKFERLSYKTLFNR